MDQDAFENLALALDKLIDLIDLTKPDTKKFSLHKSVVEAQRQLFSTAAIRYAGSFTTNTTDFEAHHFPLKNFAIQIIKAKKT